MLPTTSVIGLQWQRLDRQPISLRRRRRTFVVATAVTLLIIGIPASLTLFRPSVGPRPAGAVAISEADLPSDALTAVAELRAGDELYLLPTGEHWVFARVRPGEPSLMFGTSCDVMSDTPLPEGWVGLCLEYTSNGHRVSGRFPYGTLQRLDHRPGRRQSRRSDRHPQRATRLIPPIRREPNP